LPAALWRYWLMASITSEGPTWDALIEEVRCGPGTDARHEAGAWAMERVRSALGEDWPRRWHDRAGTLPGFVLDPASNACAYAQLLETGLRLHSLAGVLRLRRLTREWSRQLELIRMLHAFMQLEVAALARFAGAGVEFERPVTLPATSRPADVGISTEGIPLIAECFCVYNDQDTSAAMAYDQSLGHRLNIICLDVRLSGHWDVRLPAAETEELLAQVQHAASEVRADRVPRDVTRPGVEFRLAPWSDPCEGELLLEGPSTPGAEWRRARGIINGKARDWAGSPLPVWLRFDLLDGTWLFSSWALCPLPDKTEWMAALMADAAIGTDIAGVVVSCGSRVDPSAQADTYAGSGGIVGLRRRLDPLRTRETIIVPLSRTGASRAKLWAGLYDAEPRWMPDALRAASLPGPDDIERGWSVPG
jgi:hypothetical protein